MLVNSQIIKINDIWKSKEYESNAKNCRENLENRIPVLSETKDFEIAKNEWRKIAYHIDYEDREELCLCGMKIKTVYIFENVITKNRVAIGSTCVDRFDKNLIKNYKKSLKLPGYCYYCDKNYKDSDKHIETKGHKELFEKFVNNRNAKLNCLNLRKIKLYIDDEKKRKEKIELEKIGRKCIENRCNKYILNSEPSFKTRCINCYLKKIKK